MKSGKKLLSALLVLCLLLSVMPLTALAVEPYDTAEVVGGQLLFTSDVHNSVKYLERVFTALKAESIVFPKLLAVGGDYEDGMASKLDTAVVGQLITAAEVAGIASKNVVLTTGNHETGTTNEEFLEATGWNRQGHTATAYTDENKNEVLYYIYSFGANTGTSYNFADSEITALGAFMAAHTDAPVFILSHYPLHYYNDRRQIINSDKVIELLNGYPNAVFVWGHNHTETDPAYGKIIGEGSTILPAQLDETGAYASKDPVEILFTCMPNGALRGNTINSELACYVEVTGSDVGFTYYGCKKNGSTKGDKNTTVEQAVNPFTLDLADVAGVEGKKIMNLSLTVDIPRAMGEPQTADAVSDRFSIEKTDWSGDDLTAASKFNYDSDYDVTVTLAPTGTYTFCADTAATINGEDATVSYDNTTGKVEVSYNDFDTTVPERTPYIDPSDEIVENAPAVLAGADFYAVGNDAAAAPAAIIADQLTSDDAPEWTFIMDKDGYLLRNSEGKFLVLDGDEAAVADDPGDEAVSNWNISGTNYLTIDGAYLMYSDGGFYTSSTLDAATGVRIYQTAPTPVAGEINVVAMKYSTPKADQAVADNAVISSDANYTVDEFGFEPDDDTFAYGTVYTAVAKMAAKDNFDFAENVLVRINGETFGTVARTDADTLDISKEYPMTREVLKALPEGAVISEVTDVTDQDAFDEQASYVITAENGGTTYALVNNPEGLGFEAQEVTVSDGKIVSSNVYTDMLWTADVSEAYKAVRFQNGSWYMGKVSGGPDATGLIRTDVSAIPDTTADALWSFDGTTSTITALGGKEAEEALRDGSGSGSAPPPPPGGGGGPARADILGMDNGIFTNVAAGTVKLYKVTYNADAEALLDGEDWDVDMSAVNGDNTIEETDGELTGMLYNVEYKVLFDGDDYGVTVKNGVYSANGVEIDSLKFYSVLVRDYDGRTLDEQIVIKGSKAVNPVDIHMQHAVDYYKVEAFTGELRSFSFDDAITAETVVMVDFDKSVIRAKEAAIIKKLKDKSVVYTGRKDSQLQQIVIAGDVSSHPNTNLYTDVTVNDWFYTYVHELTAAAVVNGYPDGSFRPYGEVTWGEALKLVMKTVGYADQAPTSGHWASGYMDAALADGLIPAPVKLDAVIARGEIAQLAAKALKLGAPKTANPFEDDAPEAAIALYEAGIITGSMDGGLLLYRTNSGINRAEMSAIIWRMRK